MHDGIEIHEGLDRQTKVNQDKVYTFGDVVFDAVKWQSRARYNQSIN